MCTDNWNDDKMAKGNSDKNGGRLSSLVHSVLFSSGPVFKCLVLLVPAENGHLKAGFVQYSDLPLYLFVFFGKYCFQNSQHSKNRINLVFRSQECVP
jgi:hypothetical protein